MTQKTKDWATPTQLNVYQPWHRKLKIEQHEPTKSLPTMTQKINDSATRTPLKVYLPWHRKQKIEPHEPTKSLPTMTQKTKDWATRTPLKVYQPWHRKLKIEPHEPHKKSNNHDKENYRDRSVIETIIIKFCDDDLDDDPGWSITILSIIDREKNVKIEYMSR
jgi:hypothetical protein